ncbi:MAG: septum formation initiator family protein [Candidatus Margulisbacteria bacterium]|nr:septum formation initiator family protein [Candidatus Margulisiibacteriota bacterium]
MKRIGWIILALLVLYFIFLIRQDIINNLDLQKESHRTAARIKDAERLYQALQNRMLLLNKDAYIEKLARTKLGLVKKGEKAYKVIF